MSTGTVFKDKDICKLGILRLLLRGKQLMDDLPPISSVTLRGKNEAPNGERKRAVREPGMGGGRVQEQEEKSGQEWREKLRKGRGYCPTAAPS